MHARLHAAHCVWKEAGGGESPKAEKKVMGSEVCSSCLGTVFMTHDWKEKALGIAGGLLHMSC